MHLAGVLSEVLPTHLDVHTQEQLRLAALLHDIGHGPFSHVFESLLGKYFDKNREDFVPWLLNEREIAQTLESVGLHPHTAGRLAIGKLSDRRQPFLEQIISS